MMTNRATYSRKDVLQRTALNAPAFDAFTRKGILRPVPGTAGDKRHRDFTGSEVFVAIIMAELFRHGMTMNQLSKFVMPYHKAIDWFRAHGIEGFGEVAEILFEARKQQDSEGLVDLTKLSRMDGFGKQWPLRGVELPERNQRKVNWDQLGTWLREEAGFHLPDDLAEACRKLNPAEWDEHFLNYFTVSDENDSLIFVQSMFWYNDPIHSWLMEYEKPDPSWSTFLTIDVERIKIKRLGLKRPRLRRPQR